MDTSSLIQKTLAVALDKKGEDLRVLDVSESLGITDYFVLITAGSRRQAQAICAAIDQEAKHAWQRKARIEGYQGAWWVLMDFDEIVVHILQTEARDFYDLEQLWADATDRTADYLAALPAAAPPDARNRDFGGGGSDLS